MARNGRLVEIGAAVERAAAGFHVVVELPGLNGAGRRRLWCGVAEVCGRDVIHGSTAHAASLGKMIAASGICATWPECVFRLTIVTAGGGPDRQP